MDNFRTVRFLLNGMVFEYDAEKNLINLEKHGISLRNAALVFFDYDRIEYYDETHSDIEEDRYNTIGSVNQSMIGAGNKGGILFVRRVLNKARFVLCAQGTVLCVNTMKLLHMPADI